MISLSENIDIPDDLLPSKKEIIRDLFNMGKNEPNQISKSNIPIIIQFPEGDFNSVLTLFKQLGGTIKSTYKEAINGFAGAINYEGLNQFCELLRFKDVPFLIEEDSVFEANLYYTSRNMNLRPYVWKNLSYTGDPYSSIAIVDTGIDPSHNFFTPGYSDKNFDYKMVGWWDAVSGLPDPYDDNGHGSHCAGIATGEGSPTLDWINRTIATASLGLNYPFMFPDSINVTAARFNVTEPGTIDVECEFEDLTTSGDDIFVYAYLYYNDTLVDSYIVSNESWSYNLTYTATPTTIGNYSLILTLVFNDSNSDFMVSGAHFRVRGVLHWPFNPPLYNSGNPWMGVAPDAHLVGVKVLNNKGGGTLSDIIDGINWVVIFKDFYNITTMSLSLGGGGGQTSMIDAVNNAVENGIVTVVAAGNSYGSPFNQIGSPGDADNVITVAAMSAGDQVTEYSSSGGFSYTGATIKPDIMAPGGSWQYHMMFSTDTNENDAEAEYSTDKFPNDLYPAVGTSMSTPAVAGASNLLIDAMGGHQNWNYTGTEAKRVKALLLMTATETYPLTREIDTMYSPLLNRGGKDTQEGYGRINVDAAIEAYTEQLAPSGSKNAWLSSSVVNPYAKHALGCYVNLIEGENYKFSLDVPSGADFDMHLYSNVPSSIGDPIILRNGTTAGLDFDEEIHISSNKTGKYYLVAKAISGEGLANITYHINAMPPALTGGSVNPPTGNQSTLFNFSIVYTDLDDITPTYVKVLINGIPYLMQKQNPSDNNYTDGCTYQFLTYLQPGTYNYYFECKDGSFINSTVLYTGLNIVKTNLNPPNLIGQFNPIEGVAGETIFNFTALYIDSDNNAPDPINVTIDSTTYLMNKIDPTDINYMDGCIYIFNTSFANENLYSHYFNCSDGDFYDSDGPFIGPLVKIRINIFEDNFESGLSKWETITGLWHLTDDSSSWSDPYYSPTHSMWFGQESTGTYDTGNREMGDLITEPLDLSTTNNALLEFYHWRKSEPSWDYSFVEISTDNETWDIIYTTDFIIDPWYRSELNISNYCGNSSVRIKFRFDTGDPIANAFRGWLVDDISVYSLHNPNFNTPQLMSDRINPTSGNQTTLFNFSVIYFDIDNNMPAYVDLLINRTRSSMYKQNPIDVDYTDGCIFQYQTYLQPGNYLYSFECADWKFSDSTAVYSNLSVSSTANLLPPSLNLGQVSPSTGFNGTNYFNFYVNYIDADNNAPTILNITINSTTFIMTKQDPLDDNYMDGCVYIYSTTLDQFGNYTYFFNCSDGIYYAGLGPYIGPEVKTSPLFHGMYVNHYWEISYGSFGPSSYNFSYVSGSMFHTTWNNPDGTATWDVDINTRIMTNAQGPWIFGSNVHTPFWIHTNASLSDLILIAVDGVGDRTFSVSDESTVLLPGYGLIEVWVLQDQAEPTGFAWYDKGTGILIYANSTFFGDWYNFDFQDSNVVFSYVPNNFIPQLTSGMVDPITGNQSTLFNFSVVYTDLDNDYPFSINVIINGTPFSMEKQNPLDFNYTDGCQYQYLTYLQPGNYNYAFNCSDWSFYNSTIVYTGLIVTDISNINPPVLNNGQVTPGIGYDSATPFKFSINYSDSENDAPVYINITINSTTYAMYKNDSLDTNYMDGCLYLYETLFSDGGNYNYFFNSSDGDFNASLGPFSGPYVEMITLFDGMYVNHTYTFTGMGTGSSVFFWSYKSDSIFHNDWNNFLLDCSWDVNLTSRIMTNAQGGLSFGNGFRTPAWIFTNVSLGDTVLIAVDGEGDHMFNVSNELEYNLTGYGYIGVWVLEDLTTSGGIAWYEKTTGILLNGSFIYGGGAGSYSYDFVGTNAELSYIPNDYTPQLSLASIFPATGNQTTLFNFSVIYTDMDNNRPNYINVLINGSNYPMVKQNSSDKDYTDGCLYQFLAFLQPGTYNYLFECADWKFSNSTIIYLGPNVTIGAANLNVPTLTNGFVTPGYGFYDTTQFVFSVNYSDIDNDAPVYITVTINSEQFNMSKQNPSDTNFMDGCIYIYKTNFSMEGFNIFYFNCSDANFSAGNGPFVGPSLGSISLFEGLYINHKISITGGLGSGSSSLLYSYDSLNTFNVQWTSFLTNGTWDVDMQTRRMTDVPIGLISYAENSHTSAWIYTNTSIGDIIYISVLYDGDHFFNVTEEITYYLTGFGNVKVWVLQDLFYPNAIAYYEQSTGMFLEGTFYFLAGSYSYTFEFVDTNIDFKYITSGSPKKQEPAEDFPIFLILLIISAIAITVVVLALIIRRRKVPAALEYKKKKLKDKLSTKSEKKIIEIKEQKLKIPVKVSMPLDTFKEVEQELRTNTEDSISTETLSLPPDVFKDSELEAQSHPESHADQDKISFLVGLLDKKELEEDLKLQEREEQKFLEEDFALPGKNQNYESEMIEATPIVTKTRIRIGLICPDCHTFELIPKWMMDTFICLKCSNPTYGIAYHCANCSKNYMVNKEDFFKYKEPKILDCPVCNEKMELLLKVE